MIDFAVRNFAKWLLSLRYSVTVSGLETITARGKNGILFLPNHPALIDPVIVYVYLHKQFAPHGFADKDQMDRPIIHWFAKRWGVRAIPSMAAYGSAAADKIEKVLDESIAGLKNRENLLLWPAGHLAHGYKEIISGTSAVERILKQCPDVRVVLVRTKGLWGSSFSWASGRPPKAVKALANGLLSLLVSGVFFAPRRRITIEFYEPPDLPRHADRNTLNTFLENYYNKDARHNTYVPYTIWERKAVTTLPEPALSATAADISAVLPSTRQIVLNYLSNLTGISQIRDGDHLGRNLGMDSLARTDLLIWLEKEFGFPITDIDALQTVGDVLLAASGRSVYSGPLKLKPVPSRWFACRGRRKLSIPAGTSIQDVFLKQAAASPSNIAVADQTTGVKSYRDIITACMVLKPAIEKLNGDYVGIMMPASVAADILYLATLFAGKIPVMVNWTVGIRNITESLNSTGVKHILTSKALADRITSQGIDLSGIKENFVFIESLAADISKFWKFRCWLNGHLNWSSLRSEKFHETAVVLFTSGSETLPKAVPLTHANLLTNIRDVLQAATVYETDRLIGFLPPFHSFGLTCNVLLPLCCGAQVVYHPSPTDSGTLARLIDAYGVTVLMGTPTFLGGIVRAADKQQLSSLRLAVTGAERCSEEVYAAIKEKCTNATILEGYGVTECSPIISINDENSPQPFTIGKILPSLEYLLIDPDSGKPLAGAGTGILLVTGPSVFSGYLNYSGQSPFAEINGKRWYNTGDIVNVDEKGLFTFRGRLKRFVKLGGEMISLPAIEAVLEQYYPPSAEEGPALAVEAAPDEERPELVLFTIYDINREEANDKIHLAGLSGLHNVRRVIKLEKIPTLATGKTDYRALREQLKV